MISTGNQARKILIIGGFISLAFLLSYVFVYIYEPFSEIANLFALDLLTAVAALSCAVSALLVLRCYEPDEPLRKVWTNFSIGLWLWFTAEMSWMIYDLVMGDVPDFSLADVFWLAGYIFFSLALLSQFKVVFSTLNRARMFFLAIWFVVIILTLGTAFWLMNVGYIAPEDFFEKLALYFYPFADMAIALFAIILVRTFRGGTFARPWLSMLVFVISDTLYLVAMETGLYDNINIGELSGYFRLLADSLYIIAYLVLAWGILSQYTTLKFGAGRFVGPREITRPLNKLG